MTSGLVSNHRCQDVRFIFFLLYSCDFTENKLLSKNRWAKMSPRELTYLLCSWWSTTMALFFKNIYLSIYLSPGSDQGQSRSTLPPVPRGWELPLETKMGQAAVNAPSLSLLWGQNQVETRKAGKTLGPHLLQVGMLSFSHLCI